MNMIRIDDKFVAISKANFILSLEFHNWNREKLNELQERCRILRNQIVHHEDVGGDQSHLVRRLNKTLKQFKKQKSIIARKKPNQINNENGRHYQIEFFDFYKINQDNIEMLNYIEGLY